jgi:transposase
MSSKSNIIQIPSELLGLSHIKIISSSISHKKELIIVVESTKEIIPCRKCGKPTEPYGTSRVVQIRHLPVFGMKTFIEITPRRGKCPYCDDNPTSTEQPDWYKYKSRNTKAYENYLMMSLINSTIQDVSIKEDVGYHVVERILEKYIEEEIDFSKFNKLGIIGIDEIALKKGYNDYVTIITSRCGDTTRLLAVLKGKNKNTVYEFLHKIPKKLHKTIVAVCCDLCDNYIEAANEAFDNKVAVVADRFHVAKLYRKCLVDIRKKELIRLRKTLSSDEYKTLKDAVTILVKKKELYTKDDLNTLKPLFKYSPALKAACRLCRSLTSIFNTKHRRKTATVKIEEWITKVEESELVGFNCFIKTLNKYKKIILNYFGKRLTSGFVEGLNNKIKVMKRRCYGIFNIKNLFRRITLDLEGYSIIANYQMVTAS